MTDDDQQTLDTYREMNRYADRHADWRSDEIYSAPRRTMSNRWAKFHAARDCGRQSVRYVEDNQNSMATSDKWDYDLRCSRCGFEVDETEVLFIGGEWYNEIGWLDREATTSDLFIPPERVLDLGPDPDQADLRHALRITRIEGKAGPSPPPVTPGSWKQCEECDHPVPLLFDDRCRMCYDGEWTDRLQASCNAFEGHVREWLNNSFVHRLPQKVDPCSPGVGPGAILWRRHHAEQTSRIVEVTKILDERNGDDTYVALADPTHTERWQYHLEDVKGCFWDTGLRTPYDAVKPIENERIADLWRRLTA